ncbi:MAG: hypothetical protein SWH68_01295 [Thermodesulfobacteriota bacterium]|nr:hypothetical protein [Thermodesulfobacteriota bacterium]
MAGNYIVNGSFEITTIGDVPDGWGQYLGPKKIHDWFDLWKLDDNTAFHGKKSLCITAPTAGDTLVQLQRSTMKRMLKRAKIAKPKNGRPHTLSLYMKGNRKSPLKIDVRICFHETSYVVQVDDQWKRYTFTQEVKLDTMELVDLAVMPEDPGATIWIDAVQLEEGKKATTYKPSINEKRLYTIPAPDTLTEIHGTVRKYTKNFTSDRQFQVFPRYSFFTDEPRIFFDVRLPQYTSPQADWQITLTPIPASRHKAAEQNAFSFALPETPLWIPASRFSKGQYKVTAELKDQNGNVRAKTAAALSILPAANNPVKIDHSRRCFLVDGAPFFFFAATFARAHLYDHRWAEMLDKVRDLGYTVVVPSFCQAGNNTRASTEKIRHFLDMAHQRDLKVVIWITTNAILSKDSGFQRIRDSKPQIIQEHYRREYSRLLPALKSHPALLGWYIYDEPDGQLIKKGITHTLVNHAKSLDPYHPVYINYAWAIVISLKNNLSAPGDIMSLDFYPIPDRKMSDLAWRTKATTIAGENRKPTIFLLQFFSDTGRHPTPRELKCMAYLASLNGATGFQTWPMMPNSKIVLNAISPVIKEMKRLHPVLQSSRTRAIQSGSEWVQASARYANGSWYIIAVNFQHTEQAAHFQLPGDVLPEKLQNKKINVLFENRSIDIHQGVIADTFLPYERHVYLIQ